MQVADVIRKNKPDVTQSTVRTYAAHIKRIKKAVKSMEEGAVLEYLDSLKPKIANQLISAVTAFDVAFRVHIARYRKVAAEQHAAEVQKSTVYQRNNWTSLKALNRAVRLMRREITQFGFGAHKLVSAYISWSIMLEFTMRNDLPTFLVAETSADVTSKKKNYYVVSLGTLIMQNFKTQRAFGRRGLLPLKLPLKKPLKLLILRYLRQRKKSTHLICQANGRPYSKHGFRNLLLNSSKKYLGVKIGSTQLRHIVLSEFLAKDPSLAERRAMAKKMQQTSLETQLSYHLRDVDEK
jgi:hypothetical protein